MNTSAWSNFPASTMSIMLLTAKQDLSSAISYNSESRKKENVRGEEHPCIKSIQYLFGSYNTHVRLGKNAEIV